MVSNSDDDEAIVVAAIAIADNLRSSMLNKHLVIDFLQEIGTSWAISNTSVAISNIGAAILMTFLEIAIAD